MESKRFKIASEKFLKKYGPYFSRIQFPKHIKPFEMPDDGPSPSQVVVRQPSTRAEAERMFDSFCIAAIQKQYFDPVLAEKRRQKQRLEKIEVTIDSLPEEIFLKIFGYLRHDDLGRCGRVCRKWNEITKDPILWKKVDAKFYSWKKSEAIHQPADSFLEMLPQCVQWLKMDFKPAVNDFDKVDFNNFAIKLGKCPNIKTLIMHNARIEQSLPFVIYLCSLYVSNIKELKFKDSAFGTTPLEVVFPFVSEIESLHVESDTFENFYELKLLNMLHLKKLNLSRIILSRTFLRNHASIINRVTHLDLGFSYINPDEFAVIQRNCFNVIELYICASIIFDEDIILNDELAPHLKIVCVGYCSRVTEVGVKLLLERCHSLQRIYVKNEIARSMRSNPVIALNECLKDRNK